jgi:enoyl-CoA hydratase/carnithine racemase
MNDHDCGLRVEHRGLAAIITIDRPLARNALSRANARELERLVGIWSAEPSVRGVIITGAGQEVFVAGGDLRDFASIAHEPVGADDVIEMGSTMHAIELCEVPVLAAVQGMAFGGGCELTLACDLVLMEAHATLTFREAAMGLSTGWGGGTRLVERVGPMLAARLLFLGESIGAQDALLMGLVSAVVPQGRAVEECLAWVERIARFPRSAIAGMKRMLRDVRSEQRGGAFAREAEVFASLWGKPDHLAAMDAFLSRRR